MQVGVRLVHVLSGVLEGAAGHCAHPEGAHDFRPGSDPVSFQCFRAGFWLSFGLAMIASLKRSTTIAMAL